VFAAKSFTITSSGLVAGDVLDIRLTIAVNDAATVTAVTPTIAAIDLLCDIKG
jgi:maleate cis-trans isomerase